MKRVAVLSFGSICEPSILAMDLQKDSVASMLQLAKKKQLEFLSNKPFPHIVLDGLFPDDVLEQVLKDVEGCDLPIRKSFFGSQGKFANNDPWSLGATARRFLVDLTSERFCRFLKELTGVRGIIPDAYFDGGGIHEIRKGGFLKIHSDFNWHGRMKLDRRLNVLIYLNKDWDEEWGGNLELWDKTMEERVVRINPVFNRAVIFETSDISYHGHPDPLDCPESVVRRSLATYYYTNARPTQEGKQQRRKTTDYKERPSESFER